jgi:hypothetical protein
MMVSYYIGGQNYSQPPTADADLEKFWERVGYVFDKSTSIALGKEKTAYFHAQECLFTTWGMDYSKLWNEQINILPLVQEIHTMIQSAM